jgi:hypothetical protein
LARGWASTTHKAQQAYTHSLWAPNTQMTLTIYTHQTTHKATMLFPERQAIENTVTNKNKSVALHKMSQNNCPEYEALRRTSSTRRRRLAPPIRFDLFELNCDVEESERECATNLQQHTEAAFLVLLSSSSR